MVRFGAKSLLLVLIAGPRFCGGPHASSTLARWVTQMSFPPKPPGPTGLLSELHAYARATSAHSKAILSSGFTGHLLELIAQTWLNRYFQVDGVSFNRSRHQDVTGPSPVAVTLAAPPAP